VERVKVQQPDYDALKLLNGFVEDCRLRGMTDESIRRYRSSLNLFLDFLGRYGVDVQKVDMQLLKGFLYYLRSERLAKQKTIENDFSALSAFYEYLIFEGASLTNSITSFRKRYVRRYKEDDADPERKLLTVEEMGRLVNSIIDPRDRAITVLFAKTGIRRGELLKLDVNNVDWANYSITLKPAPKRSNRVAFFDDECAFTLRRWLRVREKLNPKTTALFDIYHHIDREDLRRSYLACIPKLGV